ncbi:MAG TPA: pyridoxamine 5'-phosphate oxidase family protein [Blastocatellia bacterium]|nr:pyridoxamine 5'-phosphate oxidase family protein [Blastocatellia bacterium]
MNWNEFNRDAPELADSGQKLFDRAGVVLVGTLRKGGSPRISPVEPLIAGGQLYLGMMPDSFKAQDLIRDPRCTVHSLISDKNATEGEFKLHGRAVNVQNAEERRLYCVELQKKIGWSPEGMPFHLFSIDIQSAGFFFHDGGSARSVKRWRAGEPVRSFRQGIDGKLKQEA